MRVSRRRCGGIGVLRIGNEGHCCVASSGLDMYITPIIRSLRLSWDEAWNISIDYEVMYKQGMVI